MDINIIYIFKLCKLRQGLLNHYYDIYLSAIGMV